MNFPIDGQSAMTARKLEVIPTASGGQFTFTPDPDVSHFNLYVFAPQKNGDIELQLKDQNGTTYPDKLNRGFSSSTFDGYRLFQNGKLAVCVPYRTAKNLVMQGTWTGKLNFPRHEHSPEYEVYLVSKKEFPFPTEGSILKVNPVVFLKDNDSTEIVLRNLKKSLRGAENIFARAGISLACDPFRTVIDPNLHVSADFWNSHTQALTQQYGYANRLNLFFVENLDFKELETGSNSNPDKNALGISGGIPGMQGSLDHRSACLIKLSWDPDDLSQKYIAQRHRTIAHEIGHYLGLIHQPSSKNLMFAKATTGSVLSDDQVHVLQSQPMVFTQYLSSTKHRINKVKLEITTGNRNPGLFDGPGTSQSIRFYLGKYVGNKLENGFFSMVLNSGPYESYFQKADHTDILEFNLTNSVFIEDVSHWSLSSHRGSSSGLFWTWDWWDLKQVKVYLNDTLVFDEVLNTYVGGGGKESSVTKAINKQNL